MVSTFISLSLVAQPFVQLVVQPVAQSAAQMRLQTAVQANDAAGIDQAVKAGADLNARGGGGQTPLMSAVLSGKTEAVRALLKHQPDVTIGEKDGYTPMHGAGFQVWIKN